MSFLNYGSTRPWAKAMKAAVVSKKMPPWGADSQYGHFKDDPSVTPSEIEAIVKWADTGSLEGDARDAPPPVQWAEGDQSWVEMMAPWIGLVLPGHFDPKKENVFTSNPD